MVITRRNTTRSTQKGVALIETALTLPLVLLVIFGIVNFGFALYNKSVITNISREAARSGIIFSGDTCADRQSSIEAAAEARCLDINLVSFNGNNECTAVASCNADGSLSVQVNFPFGTIAGGLMPGMGESMNLSSVTRMQFEPI